MTGADTAAIVERLERLETRMSALESARTADLAAVPGIVMDILRREMPALVRDNVRTVINEERLVADAQRFREFVSLGRKIGVAVAVAVATTAALAVLNGWIHA